MNRISRLIITAACSVGIFAAGGLQAREIPVPPAGAVPEVPTYSAPAIEKLGNGMYRIGEIVLNRNDKSVAFPAQVNMDTGMLEYLLVHRVGKTHESLLRTNISPYNLQLAFMLLGYEGSDKRLAGQGAPETPKGEAVRITLSSVAGKQTDSFPVEQWLSNKIETSTKDVEPLKWVFCGSYVNELGGFMSQVTGSIVAIWHDPVALIDNASPGGESNRIWFVKQGTVPPVGTNVIVTIKPVK